MASLPPRKYVFVAVFVTLFLYGITTIRSLRPSVLWSNASSYASTKPSPPLLGADEIPAALYYPSLSYDAALQIPVHNRFPSGRPRPSTPLFIGFTRTQSLLEQTVASYISAGWPRSDIIVVDNSGTLDANLEGLLSPENPFALNYTLLREVYGVSILQTPTLLSFAQLMNFYLRTATAQQWSIFFWTHQDVAVLGDETAPADVYRSFYQRVLDTLAGLGIKSEQDFRAKRDVQTGDWAVKFFSYDWLTLVNVAAWRKIGQWDTFIPYYTADCDAYSRIALHGFTKEDAKAGHIFDVSEAVMSPVDRFFATDSSEGLNSHRYDQLKMELDILKDKKWKAQEASRNSWQTSTNGGQGEPWTYDAEGFQKMWWETANHGRLMYRKKWGIDECRLEDHGKQLEDQFKGA